MSLSRTCGPVVLAALIGLLPASPAAAQVVILHNFTGHGDGADPAGSLFLSGSTLFGTTETGGNGPIYDGTIFQILTNGTGYNMDHSFGGPPNDGANPQGSLIQYGSAFYGLTSGGGSANGGTVFQVGPNGTAYGVLYQFLGAPGDGSGPYGSLVRSGSTFYGMTSGGGSANRGKVFKINADGTGETLLYQFAGSPNDGQQPYGSLVLSGSTLYGMTAGGGSAGGGTIFKINTDGTGYTVLHSFEGRGSDGSTPFGSLTVSGSTLYGTTAGGGGANDGTVFKINVDGSGFSLLHSFAGGPTDGGEPLADLLLSGATLYGTTAGGGPAGDGTIFQIGLDGTNYGVLHYFLGGAADGAGPGGDLTLSDGIFYGTTEGGGSSNEGTVFSFAVPEPSSFVLVMGAAAAAAALRRRRRGRLLPKRICPTL